MTEGRHLPNAELARVEPTKVLGYLLAVREQDDKSGLFARFGFRREAWEELRDALLQHGRSQPVVEIEQTPFGVLYTVVGPLRAPRWPIVRTVWEIRKSQVSPRLITAFPVRVGRQR